uniref:spermatogenesis-associated protein 20 isoform X3 n=1 Tax=Semicossyphus pulcher TaxID=241346 RepID=UPI0037E8234C
MLSLARRQSAYKNSLVEPARLLTSVFLGADSPQQISRGNIFRLLAQIPHPPSDRSTLLQIQPAYYLSSSVFMSMASGGEGSSAIPHRHTNRLAKERSPYLLQHAHNPVDWYPWGQDAFNKAKNEDKPIFLSVGYSTCHWCHVMERESFEDEEIGKILSDNFVCIKLDREERPDVDKVYMTFVQATSGGGGWPMSVWLTPDLRPFIGGTYFPPRDHGRRPGLKTVLTRIIQQGFHRYSTDSSWHVPHFEKMLYDQAQLAVAYINASQVSGEQVFADVAKDILLYVSRDLSDQSGGFYSAEDADSVPASGGPEKREGAFCVWTASEVRELLQDVVEGATGSATQADIFMHHYGVKEQGNVDPEQDPHGELQGQNVLIVRYSVELTAAHFGINIEKVNEVLASARAKMAEVRKSRPRPHLDTKMLASWNGLMLSAYARVGAVLGDKALLERAMEAGNFLKDHLWDAERQTILRSCYRGDQMEVQQISPPISGFLDDYAFIICGLLDLYEATLQTEWLQWAEELQLRQDVLFLDDQGGGYFCSDPTDSTVLLRLKEDQDGAEPSGNSVSASNLLRLSRYTGRQEWLQRSQQLLAAFSDRLTRVPIALPEMVRALMTQHYSLKQIVICGQRDAPDTTGLLAAVNSLFLPHKVLILIDNEADSFLSQHLPMLSSMTQQGGVATAYVCQDFTCSLPVTEPQELRRLLLDGTTEN